MPLADASQRPRRLGGAVAAVLLLGPLAWSVLWHLLTGGSPLDGLRAPWSAANAYIAGPAAGAGPLALAAGGAAALVLLVVALILAPAPPPVYGDARFATRREIAAMGLRARSGLIVGRLGGMAPAYLRHGGPQHVLLVAPTRSGKGVGIVTPNLLSWPGSVVVLDVKNENFETSSGFRQRCGQAVFRFAPGDPALCTHRYNPLDAVRRDATRRVADLQAIAHLLTPGGAGEQRMWNEEARALFVGLCLYILDSGLPLTFGQVTRILQTDADLGEVFAQLVRSRGEELDAACVNILSNFAHKAFKERSGVKSTLTGALALWNDPAIDAATALSDFSLEALRREPVTIYVSVSLDQLERLSFLLALVFQQLAGILMRAKPGSDEPVPVLMLVDEFAALGRLDTIVDRMPFLAGFNVRLLLVVQGLAQLDRLYGLAGRELILQNAGLQLFFSPNDEATTGYVSARLGMRTVRVRTLARSTPAWGGGAGSVTRGTSLLARPLLSADEARRLGPKSAILFVEGARPVRAARIAYHADPRFTARLRPPVEIAPIASVRHVPFRFDSAASAASLTPSAAHGTVGPKAHAAASAVASVGRPRATPARRQRNAAAGDPFAQLDFDRLVEMPPGEAG